MQTLRPAAAAGYVPVSPTNYPVVYYVNPTIVAANAAAKRTLDPASIDGLVYAQTPAGTQELPAAHVRPAHHALDTTDALRRRWSSGISAPRSAVRSRCNRRIALDITGPRPCVPGTVQKPTPYVTMVWQVPVAGGPLAIQPPDIQIVEASVMASSGS